jgi:alpha-galactosidase/6-phospho-beta-glucosidase family protein
MDVAAVAHQGGQQPDRRLAVEGPAALLEQRRLLCERRIAVHLQQPALDLCHRLGPRLLEKRGGAFYSEAAIGLLTSLVRDSGDVHVVDVRNAGTLAGLADDDVVEVPARVRAAGAEPLEQAPLAPELLGLVQHASAYERLAVAAAVTGSPETVHKALLAHPLIGQYPLADELLERLLDAGAAHLPQFARTTEARA